MNECPNCQKLEERVEQLQQSNMNYVERLRVCYFALSASDEDFAVLKRAFLFNVQMPNLEEKNNE